MKRSYSVPPKGVFSLLSNQIPEPPSDATWVSTLRWLVMVMNHNDPQLHFASSCLSYALKNGGLTKKQSEACQKLYARIMAAYEDQSLNCQWFLSEEDFAHDQICDALHEAYWRTKH